MCGKHGAHCSLTLSGHPGPVCICHQMCALQRDRSCSGYLVGWTILNCQHLFAFDLQKWQPPVVQLARFNLPPFCVSPQNLDLVPGSLSAPPALLVFLSNLLWWPPSSCPVSFLEVGRWWGVGRALGWQSHSPLVSLTPTCPLQSLPPKSTNLLQPRSTSNLATTPHHLVQKSSSSPAWPGDTPSAPTMVFRSVRGTPNHLQAPVLSHLCASAHALLPSGRIVHLFHSATSD